jgi:hypothetical protein
MKIRLSFPVLALFVVAPASVVAAPPRAEPDRLTPRDAEMVLQVNVRQMLQKKLALDPLKAVLQHNDELQQLLKAAAIDPLKDIDTLSLSTSGNPLEGGKLLAVVRGKFAPDKAWATAEEYAKKHPGSLKILKDGSVPMGEIVSDHKSFYAAFAGDKTLVMTTKKEDTVAVVQRAGQTAQPLSAAMQTALGHLKGSESLWLALVATDDIKQLLKGDDLVKDLAASLLSVTGALEVDDDARFGLVVHTNSAKAAERLKGKFEELMQLLMLLGSGKDNGDPIVKNIFGNIKLNAEKNDVSLRLHLTEAQIEKASKKER